jgi:syntaxin 8
MAQHDQIIAQQDRGLDTLSHIISNQKQIALTIGNEVDKQNVFIDHIGDKVESVNERLITETKHIKLLGNYKKYFRFHKYIFFF